MFSYDELVGYVKRYHFRRDKNTDEKKLYDSESAEFVSDNPDTKKIMAAIAIMRTLQDTEQQYDKLYGNRPPYNTKEEEVKWKKEQIQLLQENLLKILSSGSYHIHISLAEAFKMSPIDRMFFLKLSNPDKCDKDIMKQSNALMEYLLESNGKK